MTAKQRTPNAFRGMSDRDRLRVWNTANERGVAGLVEDFGPERGQAIAAALGLGDDKTGPDPMKGLSPAQTKRLNHAIQAGLLTRIKAIVGEKRGAAIGALVGLERDARRDRAATPFGALHRRLA